MAVGLNSRLWKRFNDSGGLAGELKVINEAIHQFISVGCPRLPVIEEGMKKNLGVPFDMYVFVRDGGNRRFVAARAEMYEGLEFRGDYVRKV